MKNLTMRLFVVLMVVFLCISLSACDLVGGGKAPDVPSTEDPAPEQPGETPEQPGETPEQPGETPEQPGQTPEDPGETPSACVHVLGETVTVPATCTTDGYTAKKCSLCKEEYEKTTLSAPGHTYGAWCENTATCTKAGTEKRYCTVANCGDFETRDTAALNHDPISHEGKAPTCTEDGYTAYETCSRCDHNTKQTLKATGHTYGAWCENTATCTEAGTEKRYCTVANCGDFETRDTAALEHDYVDGKCDICGLGVSEGLEYSLSSDGTYYIVSIGTCTDTDIVIPSVYEGLPVKEIGDGAFFDCTNLTSITIPDSVTSIGSYAFGSCTGLASVTIPSCVQTIGNYAFGDCTSLKEVNFAENGQLLTISSYAFANCTGLASVTIPSCVQTIGNYAFYGCAGLKEVTFAENSQLLTIGSSAFRDCTSLTSIMIPDSVTAIGSYAFGFCTSLTSVTIESGSIGSDAFRNCTSLASVTIGNGVTTIDSDAFEYCYKLVEVINKSSLSISAGRSSYGYVGYYAKVVHSGESQIVNLNDYLFITLNGVHYLLGYVGDDADLVLPTSYNGENYEIYKYAFYGCRSLASVVIPNSVTTIGDYAFYGCRSLASITIPSCVETIGKYAFSGCTSLKEVTFAENGQLTISSYAFANCTSLTSITIPSSVQTIGDAFSDCTSLKEVIFAENSQLLTIGDYAFYRCTSLASITIPNSVTTIGEHAFANCDSLASITIPNSVTSIGEHAFGNCDSLASITIPNSVTSIGSYAFYLCTSLTSVTIGNGVTSIGSLTFYECYSLVEVINKSSLPIFAGSKDYGYVGYYAKVVHSGESLIVNLNDYLFITANGIHYLVGYVGTETDLVLPANYNGENYEINSYAFYNCNSLTSVVIPNSVTTIGDYAFYGCYCLTSITIPDSVTSIGAYAFYNCDSLASVVFKNTSGWWVSTSETATGGGVSVTNASTAAKYLTNTYCYCNWRRS